MTLLQKLSLAAIFTPAAFSVAASIPKTILPDNVIRCEPDTGCLSATVNGHNYKVLNTPRFTVMVAVSHEGGYTRADVNIINKSDLPLNISPDDFRVEVLTPKPKVLNYIPPADLNLPSPVAALQPIATPQLAASGTPAPQSSEPQVQPPTPPVNAESEAGPAASTAETGVPSAPMQDASQDVGQKAVYDHHLSASSIPPNEA